MSRSRMWVLTPRRSLMRVLSHWALVKSCWMSGVGGDRPSRRQRPLSHGRHQARLRDGKRLAGAQRGHQGDTVGAWPPGSEGTTEVQTVREVKGKAPKAPATERLLHEARKHRLSSRLVTPHFRSPPRRRSAAEAAPTGLPTASGWVTVVTHGCRGRPLPGLLVSSYCSLVTGYC